MGRLCGFVTRVAFLAPLALGACSVRQSVAAADPGTDGGRSYQQNCAVCHGERGDGQGPAAAYLDPRPRDFRAGAFRLVSTDNGIPALADVARTIDRGMPGTAMPPWAHLPEAERRALAERVLTFARDALVEEAVAAGKARKAAEQEAASDRAPGRPVPVPPPSREFTPAESRAAFVHQCAKCHGEDGRGRNDPKWRTQEGHPIVSRDFVRGVFKGGRDDRELYHRIATGMPGTPMPSFQVLAPDDIWKMVRYIQSLSPAEAQERAWVRQETLHARRVAAVDATALAALAPTHLALLPLAGRAGSIDAVRVRAGHDEKELAFLLEWDDASADTDGGSVGSYADGAAVMLSPSGKPPSFAMGDPGTPCHIWYWKAHWMAPLQEVAGLAMDKLPLFETAVAADNAVAAAAHAGGLAEELHAIRFSTLTSDPATQQGVRWSAAHDGRVWRVLLRHPLGAVHPGDVDLARGRAPVAFSIWNGAIADRNGQKSVSIWQALEIDR